MPLLILWGFFRTQSNNSFAEATGEHHHHAIEHQQIVVELETTPKDIKAQTQASLVFYVKDSTGKPVQDLAITHDRILHIIIISEDFSVFSHIHPEDFGSTTPDMKKQARFPIRYTFTKAGKYLIAVDGAVKDTHFSKLLSLNVSGEPTMGAMKKDFSREKKFNGYQVTLTSLPQHLRAGQEAHLTYSIKKDGKPVTELEPYLAAPMHIAIVSSDLKNFIHAHGEVPGTSSTHHHDAHGAVPHHFGPTIEAHVVFPAKGLYQIFSEVKHQGKVLVSEFTVEVE